MDENPSRSRLKRPLSEDEDEDEPHRAPVQKRPRFPKGKKDVKKAKREDSPEQGPIDGADARSAAKERAKRRNQITAELFSDQSNENLKDICAAEENYDDYGNFEDDGILIEPFNLDQEREEGYFDAEGNFVEYVKENEIQDAWLDSVDVNSRLAKKVNVKTSKEEEVHDLSSDDIGKIKRRIANLLQPGETVLQALRRLKGISNDKKGRMPEETKRMFDQLTDDAMKLMENDVYHDEREVFEREAEGYERIACVRDGTTMIASNGTSDSGVREDIFSNVAGAGVGSFPASDLTTGHSNLNTPTAQVSSGKGGDTFDMFGEDDVNANLNPPSNGDCLGPQPISESLVSSQNMESEGTDTELGTDYMYDETSGYYYSSSSGYYYDPTSGLYCCATSGRWYSYNEQTCTYDEITGEAVVDDVEGQRS